MDMFIVSSRPNWEPGDLYAFAYKTIEEAERQVRAQLADRADDGMGGTYYIRQVDLGDQLKYSSEVVVNITASAYPEEEDASE